MNGKKVVIPLFLLAIAAVVGGFLGRLAHRPAPRCQGHASAFSDYPFTADTTIAGKEFTSHGETFASCMALRSDVSSAPGVTVSAIVRYDKGVMWTLFPNFRYVETPIAKGTDVLSLLREKGARVEKQDAGPAQVGSYACEKYHVKVSVNGHTGSGWIWVAQRKDLHGFIVQAKDDASGITITLSHIELGAPPSSLFDLPKGEQRMQPGWIPVNGARP